MPRTYWTPEQRREYDRQWYAKNRERIIKSRLARKSTKREEYKLFKEDLSCVICGENESVCLDFHHTDATQKEFNVSQAYWRYGKEKVEKELLKCIVLCANCHRKLHANKISLPV